MKMKKLKLITDLLNFIIPNPRLELYHINNFTLLIAILLSSRSRDVKVNKVTKNLFQKADNPIKMKMLGVEQIKFLIKKNGLHNIKSKNIYNTSNILIKNYNGNIPNTFKELELLPGIGHKAASIIMCNIFKKPAFPVDTHVNRLMNKWKLTNSKNVINIEEDAKFFFPKKKWCKIHSQIVTYGKKYYNKNDIISIILKSKFY